MGKEQSVTDKPATHYAPPKGIEELPPHVDLVWHGANDAINLRHFLASPVPWVELDVNLDPDGERLILRHDDFATLPRWPGEQLLDFEPVLARLLDHGKSIKIDFKVDGDWTQRILDLLDKYRVPGHRLWLNASLSVWDETTVRHLAARYPLAVIQVPIGALFARHTHAGQPMESLQSDLATLRKWGINRFSVNWHMPERQERIAALQAAGHAINLYSIQNLEEFLQAVALRPASVTADFNFPQWGYYGRGSGHRGLYYEYEMIEVQKGHYQG